MSANNLLRIHWVKGKKKEGYVVDMVDVDGCGGYRVNSIPCKKLEDAVKIANQEERDNEVEYGIDISLKETKNIKK
jgi:hypothetical protein